VHYCHVASAAGNNQSRNPARAVVWELWTQGIEATILDAGQPIGECNNQAKGPKTTAICHLWVGEGDGVAVFDAYVEAHITDVQDRGRVWRWRANRCTSPLPGRPLRGSLERVEAADDDDRLDSCSWTSFRSLRRRSGVKNLRCHEA